MLKNFDQHITEADGSVYKEPKDAGFAEDGRRLFEAENGIATMHPISFGTIINIILKGRQDEKGIGPGEHIEYWTVMKKIAKGGDIELTGKQRDTIRDLVARSGQAFYIRAQICEYLEAPEEKKAGEPAEKQPSAEEA